MNTYKDTITSIPTHISKFYEKENSFPKLLNFLTYSLSNSILKFNQNKLNILVLESSKKISYKHLFIRA